MLTADRRPLTVIRQFVTDPRWLPLWAWVGYMLALPIFDWLTAGEAYPLLSTLGVLLQLGVVLLFLSRAWPWPRLAATVAVAVTVTWLMEWIGSTTGFPFGEYTYSALLQPQLLGVPLLIPLAWLMMLPPAWAVTSALVKPAGTWRARLIFALVASAVFTAWDLYLDPQKVARGFWAWAESSGGYFGIPWINYFGWLLTSALVTFLCGPRDLGAATQPLALVYTTTWLLQVIGLGLFWGQPGPALVGFLAMGLFVVIFWRSQKLKG